MAPKGGQGGGHGKPKPPASIAIDAVDVVLRWRASGVEQGEPWSDGTLFSDGTGWV